MVAPSPFTGSLGPPRLPSYLPFNIAATTPYLGITVNNTTASVTIEADNIGGFATVTIYRVSSGVRTPVRGGAGIQPNGVATGTVTDYEAPLGATFYYVLKGDNSDVFTSGNYSLTFSNTDYWLKSLGSPSLNTKVDVSTMGAVVRPARVLVQSNVLGRSNPHIITDVRGGRTGQMTLSADDQTDQTALINLFSGGGVLLFQCPPSYMFADMYFVASDVTETWMGSASSGLHTWAFNFTEVDYPADSTAANTLNTYLRVTSFGSYQNLLNKRATYLAVLTTPWTSTDGTG